ncbi:hypothetical protein [uncultured Helicobacter sp.]|uniref:hypothetical protein n=1 Tax=uncultured Helicobacter sp. TaxID=175537 RepID=UPI00375267B8
MCAVAQAEAESKDSTSLDSAIFALQKSNQCVGAIAPTALEADTARLSPRLPKRPNGLQAKPQQKSGALSFSGLGRAGRGETPFLFAQTSDFEKLENIRENTTLRNLESSTDSESRF